MRKNIDVSKAADLVGETFEKGDSVMVYGYAGRVRHLRVFHDGKAAYVRTGKRGTCKIYLDEMKRAVQIDGIELPLFYE